MFSEGESGVESFVCCPSNTGYPGTYSGSPAASWSGSIFSASRMDRKV